VNHSFLCDSNIFLIINTAKNLTKTLGKLFENQLQERRKQFSHVSEIHVDWMDDPSQVISEKVLADLIKEICNTIAQGVLKFFN